MAQHILFTNPKRPHATEFSGAALIVILAASYSMFGLISKLSHEELGIGVQVAIRSGVAVLLTLPFTSLKGLLQIVRSRSDFLLLCLRSLLMYGISVPAFIYAVSYGELGIVSLVAALPFSSLWGALLFKERLSYSQVSGLGISTIGLVFLFGVGEETSALSLIAALISSITFALALVLRRAHSNQVCDAEMNTLLLLLGATLSYVGGITLEQTNHASMSIATLSNVAAGVLVACNAYIASIAFVRISAVRAGMLLMSEPVFATLLGYLVLGELPSLRQFQGASFILLGILFPALTSCRSLKIVLEASRSRCCALLLRRLAARIVHHRLMNKCR